MLTVTARDAAGNTGTATVTATYDNTPPSVSITAPAAGATVAGTVNVTANASDNIGVAGVQFLLDGVAVGAEKTSAPFSLSWATGTAANGAHTLSARARDALGNTAVATNVTVTVSNAAPSGPPPPAPAPSPTSQRPSLHTPSMRAPDRRRRRFGERQHRHPRQWRHLSGLGYFSGGLAFNGASYVTIPSSASLTLTTAMTLEAWVLPTTTPRKRSTVIMKEQPGAFVYSLYASSPTRRPFVYINTEANTSGERGVGGSWALRRNGWSYFAGTYDGVTLKIYVDGTLVSSQAVAGAIRTSTGPVRIGGNSVWGEYFQGRIDEVRIYNRALSPAEIQTDMNTPVGGP